MFPNNEDPTLNTTDTPGALDTPDIPEDPNQVGPEENHGPIPDAPVPTDDSPDATDEPELLGEDIKRYILTCSEYYANEEKGTRDTYINFWKKLENYFDGIQRIFFNYNMGWERIDAIPDDPTMYDQIINIYRAHGESLIAALSVRLPHVIFYPDDADDVNDIDTAKAYTKISGLIEKHNQSTLLFMKALFYMWNQGVACAYIYNRSSNEYGTVSIPQYGEDVKVDTYNLTCPACGELIHQEEFKDAPTPPQFDEQVMCPACQTVVAPNIDVTNETLPQVVGYTEEPKSRTCIDIFGPMYAQMPFYARKQEHIPYLRLRFEQHENLLKKLYPNISEKIHGADTGDFDREARKKSGVGSFDNHNHLVTTTCQWLRPWSYECLNEDGRDAMLAKYPDGCYAVILNDNLVAEARNENLDKHWEITHHPLSNYIHADPMGKPLAPIQELRNEGTDLAIETFEHSIPETFADPQVLNFDEYQKSEARPGQVTQAKAPVGKPLSAGFHSLKTATLNEEIDLFVKHLDSDGQFVVGSFPSIYGGPATSGSKTASEYSESRAMALQRLNITWVVLKNWWARVMSRAVVQYANGMIADEKIVRLASTETGFINDWIKQSDLQGKVGHIEPDADEELPMSFSQIKGILMDLMTLNSPDINTALFHPENSNIIVRALGIPDVYIPGKNDRDKQSGEITQLLMSPPLPTGEPTVSVDLEFDDHEVEMETIKSWASSMSGLIAKRDNPMGFANVKAHFKMHQMALSMLQPPQPEATPKEGAESNNNNPPEQNNA